jgi:hypothetical protein
MLSGKLLELLWGAWQCPHLSLASGQRSLSLSCPAGTSVSVSPASPLPTPGWSGPEFRETLKCSPCPSAWPGSPAWPTMAQSAMGILALGIWAQRPADVAGEETAAWEGSSWGCSVTVCFEKHLPWPHVLRSSRCSPQTTSLRTLGF